MTMISIHIAINGQGLVSKVKSLYGCPYGQTRFQSFLRGFMPLFVLLATTLVVGVISKLIGV